MHTHEKTFPTNFSARKKMSKEKEERALEFDAHNLKQQLVDAFGGDPDDVNVNAHSIACMYSDRVKKVMDYDVSRGIHFVCQVYAKRQPIVVSTHVVSILYAKWYPFCMPSGQPIGNYVLIFFMLRTRRVVF